MASDWLVMFYGFLAHDGAVSRTEPENWWLFRD